MNTGLHWHKIAEDLDEIAFSSTGLTVTEIDGKKMTLGRFAERIFAFAYKCPHAGGILADGFIDSKCQVVCPLHRYKFNLENGRNTTGEGYHLKHWPVEQRADGVYVGMEKTGLFGWLGG